jgi:hypothetical protein
MSASATETKKPLPWLAPVLGGVLVGLAAWLLPASLRSVSPSLLRAAGNYTPSVAGFGEQLVEQEKLGAAALVLQAARNLGDRQAPALEAALQQQTARQPTLAAWGGWDAFLDPIFNLRSDSGHAGSTPVLTFFLPAQARASLHATLDRSGSLGVQDLLRLRSVPGTGRFVPVDRPGGQPLDATFLLAAALYQAGHLSDPLQRHLRDLAEVAQERRQLGELEPVLLDLLSLGRRFDWGQLSELVHRTEDVATLDEFARLARVAPDQLPQFYAAALMGDSADHVAAYLLRYGTAGAADLRRALQEGQGAVQLLLRRQLPVNPHAGPSLTLTGALVLAHPGVMLTLKYLGFLAAFFLILRGLGNIVPSRVESDGAGPELRLGLAAIFLAGMLILSTEPYLLRAAPNAQFRANLPVLLATPPPVHPVLPTSKTTMDTSTLVSIGVFLAFQVVIYLICLRKIADIDDQEIPPLLKLRLMENEENLFDSGLYVGMIGTAAALVLQVLGVIQPNLLAAYSSNLFGIICVALIKIRHVRGFKRLLILQAQAAAAPASTPVVS